VETTDIGFSYFYYRNFSGSMILKEQIILKKMENVELVSKQKGPQQTKIEFTLKPGGEKIVLLKNWNENNSFGFACTTSFEHDQASLMKYIKDIGDKKPRLDSKGVETGVWNF
jgi:hypothetical protein